MNVPDEEIHEHPDLRRKLVLLRVDGVDVDGGSLAESPRPEGSVVQARNQAIARGEINGQLRPTISLQVPPRRRPRMSATLRVYRVRKVGPLIFSIDARGSKLIEQNKAAFNERRKPAIDRIKSRVRLIK